MDRITINPTTGGYIMVISTDVCPRSVSLFVSSALVEKFISDASAESIVGTSTQTSESTSSK